MILNPLQMAYMSYFLQNCHPHLWGMAIWQLARLTSFSRFCKEGVSFWMIFLHKMRGWGEMSECNAASQGEESVFFRPSEERSPHRSTQNNRWNSWPDRASKFWRALLWQGLGTLWTSIFRSALLCRRLWEHNKEETWFLCRKASNYSDTSSVGVAVPNELYYTS